MEGTCGDECAYLLEKESLWLPSWEKGQKSETLECHLPIRKHGQLSSTSTVYTYLHEPCSKSRRAKPPVSPSCTRLHLSKAYRSLSWCRSASHSQMLRGEQWMDTLGGENCMGFTKRLFQSVSVIHEILFTLFKSVRLNVIRRIATNLRRKLT